MRRVQVVCVLALALAATVAHAAKPARPAAEGDKVLVVMRGLPGSGKSYLARQRGQGGEIHSADDYFMRGGRYVFDGKKIGDAHRAAKAGVSSALSRGVSPIVVDNTHTQAWEARDVVVDALAHGYRVEVVEPTTPWRFNAAELAKRNQHGVPLAGIERMLARYEHGIGVKEILASTPPPPRGAR